MIKLQTTKLKFKPIVETIKNLSGETAIEINKQQLTILYFDGTLFYEINLLADFFDNFEVNENTQIVINSNLLFEAINKSSDDIFIEIEEAFFEIFSSNKKFKLRLLDTGNVDFKSAHEASSKVSSMDEKLSFKANINGELLKNCLADLLLKTDDITITYNKTDKVIMLSSYNVAGSGSLVYLTAENISGENLKSKFYSKYIIDIVNNVNNIDTNIKIAGDIDTPIKLSSKGLNSNIIALIAPRVDINE